MEWQPAIAGAVAALAGKILFDWLSHTKAERPVLNGDSGSRSIEFTHAAVRRAVREELDTFELRRSDTIRRIMKEEIEAFDSRRMEVIRRIFKEEIVDGARREMDRVFREEFERDPRRKKGE